MIPFKEKIELLHLAQQFLLKVVRSFELDLKELLMVIQFLHQSFKEQIASTVANSIGRWNNINPNILPSARNHATQTNPTPLVDNQPKYIRKGMNGLPALLFDGTNDFFFF